MITTPKSVPRGTPIAQTILYTGGPLDAYELRRIERAAGWAHIDRLAVDGGPIVEPAPIRRRLALNVVGLIGIGICAIGVTVAICGCVG